MAGELGQAIGRTFSLPGQQQGAGGGQVAGGGEDQPGEFPEVEGEKGALGAFPGTAENEAYIESITSLENWLAEQYGQGVFPDRPGDGSPESLAVGRIYRHKKESLKRQASHLANMSKQESFYRKRISEQEVYPIAEARTDPFSQKSLAPTQADFDKIVSRELPEIVKTFVTKSPSGGVYDISSIGGAKLRYNDIVRETNEHFDEMAAKFEGTQYGENVESARQQSLTTLQNVRPISRTTGVGEREKKMNINDRNQIEAEIMSGGSEALVGGVFGNDKITRAELIGGQHVLYGNKTIQGTVRETELGRISVKDRESIIPILNKKPGHGIFTIKELEREKQFPITEPEKRVWTSEDQSNYDSIIANPSDEKSHALLGDIPGVLSVTFDKGTFWDSIDIEYVDKDKEQIDPKTEKGKARLKELYAQSKGIEGDTSKPSTKKTISESGIAAAAAAANYDDIDEYRQLLIDNGITITK